MASFSSEGDPLRLDDFQTADHANIALRDGDACRQCSNKPCTYICPSEVFNWDWEEERLSINCRRCLECGACPLVCRQENLLWEYPPGNCGVIYSY